MIVYAQPMSTHQKMRYCTKCTYPVVAVNLSMRDDGMCSGCVVHEEKDNIDWDAREAEFRELLYSYRSPDGSNYDLIVPVSGGKDSHFQVWYVKEKLGLNPLLFTYYSYNFPPTGDENMRNLSRAFGVDHYVFTPSLEMVRKMNRAGFKKTGDMNWHYHCGIWTHVFQIAVNFKVPLVLYGEHGFLDLAGQYSLQDRPEYTIRDRKESGLRGYDWYDFVGMEGLTEKDLLWAKNPSDADVERIGVRGIFMGNYVYWDGDKNAIEMKKYGFKPSPIPFARTYRLTSNVDDINENGVKDWLKFVKFGYGRCTDHTSKDIRLGKMTREKGIELIKQYDHVVGDESLAHFLNIAQMEEGEFFRTADTFRDPRVWWIENGEWWKDTIWGEPASYGKVHLSDEDAKKYVREKAVAH